MQASNLCRTVQRAPPRQLALLTYLLAAARCVPGSRTAPLWQGLNSARAKQARAKRRPCPDDMSSPSSALATARSEASLHSARPFVKTGKLQTDALAALRTPARERSTEQIAALVEWCESKSVAPGGATVNLELLSRAMKLEEVPNDTILFRQGDPGSTYYIVFSGEVAIHVNSALAALAAMQAPGSRYLSSGSTSRIASKDASAAASVRQTPRIGSGPGSGAGSVKQTPRMSRMATMMGGRDGVRDQRRWPPARAPVWLQSLLAPASRGGTYA